MQIHNFNVAATLTVGTNNSNLGAGVAESGFAALLRQQHEAASSIPVRAPSPPPPPLPSQFAVSVTPLAPPPVRSPAPASASAPPATPTPPSQSTPADEAPATPSTGEESPAPDSAANIRASKTGKAARTPDKSSPAKAGHASSASADDLLADKPRKAETTHEGDEVAAPGLPLVQQVADLRSPAEPAPTVLRTGQPPTAEAGAGDPAAADDAPVGAAKPRGVELLVRSDATLKADAKALDKSARDSGAPPASLPTGTRPASDFAAAFAELRPAMSPAAQPVAITDLAAATATAAGVAAGGATFNPAPSSTREVGSGQAVQLPTPVNAPDFSQHLGTQLSVLARNGVQQAELHLNPADMGPVSVHITMDGTQARIDFGADVAATRQVIEAGMPELASALADAGFTLAGGGVSQHPRGRGEGGRGEPGSGSGARRVAAGNSDATPASRVIRSTVSVGGVDIYA